ncbi:MAG: hypothetical protein A2Y17_10105 [Clostridiales bacterium GWF2_38_85]|nr:MAG: hypothetical protein A2Y17_10105 [Clostridiales bacterium GWF2_38_85]HBL84470.1 hypothetical protein [Clostridiales bacterium]
MILCKPERNSKNTYCVIFVFSLLGISMWIFSSTFQYLKWVFQLILILSAVAAIYLIIRYTMTQYVYQLSLTDLIITKTVGNKTTTVCSLDLAESKLLVSKQAFYEKNMEKDVGYIHNKFNFCQNLNCECYYYIYSFRDKNYLIKFEPNEVFVRAMKENIGNIKKDKK